MRCFVYLILVLVLGSAVVLKAQENDGTTEISLAEAQLDKARECYQSNDNAGMEQACLHGLELLGDVDEDPKLRAALWYWAAVAAERLGNAALSGERYEKALAIQKAANLRREVAATLNSYSMIKGMAGDHAAQLAALIEARDIFADIGEVRGLAAAVNSLGNYFSDMNQPEEALPFHEQSVTLRRKLDNPSFKASGLINLGVTYQELERFDDAQITFEEALTIYREIEDEVGLATVLTNMGSMARNDGNYADALAYEQEALGYDRAGGYKYGVTLLTTNIGATLLLMERYEEALKWLDDAVVLAVELGHLPRLGAAYEKRSEAREATGDFAGALADWRAKSEATEEQASAAREEALLELQTQFETAEKQAEIEKLERGAVEDELAITRAEAAREAAEQSQAVEEARGRTTMAVAVGVGVAAIILAGLFHVSRRSARRLAHQQAEVEQAMAGLKTAHGELKRLYARKSEWLGFAVHDLRSPLFAIDACCAEIQGGLVTSPVEGVGEIRGAAKRMREELDTWLEAERKEQTEVQVHPVITEMGQLVADVVGLNQPTARAKTVRLDLANIADEVMVRVDPWRWREVVDNLVSNAIKFSPRGARVAVESGSSEGRGWVRVSDEGPGFPPEDRDQIFGAFAQLSAKPTGGETSTGLGLHLVKRLVDAHGASITVTDASNGGAIFEVSIPLES